MKISKNYFRNLFAKSSIKYNNDSTEATLNFSVFGRKLDYAQDAMKEQLLQDMLLYVPEDTMRLRDDIKTFNESNGERDAVYAFNPNGVPYGHYQFEGIMYADPITGKGAFYKPDYGFWSRPGVQKVQTTRLLKYSKPEAKRDWLRYAVEHHTDDVIQAAKNAYKKG